MEIPVNTNTSSPFQRFPLAAHYLLAARPCPAPLLLLVVMLLASAACVAAQQPLSLADADLRAQAIFQQSASTGMVLVVARNREVMIKGYGETSPANGRAPAANSMPALMRN